MLKPIPFHCLLAPLSALTLTACATPAATAAQALELPRKSLVHDGQVREWREYVPESCAREACPLVLGFHGGMGTAESFEKNTGFLEIARKHGFILLLPNGLDKNWNDGRPEVAAGHDDVGFIDKLLAETRKTYKVAPARIFALGVSNGGLFSYRLACERAETFAAIAPVVAQLGEVLSKGCKPSRPVSIISFNGTDDGLVPFKGGHVTGPLGFKKLGRVISADATAAFFRASNGCAATAERLPAIDRDEKDGTRAILEKNESCAASTSLHRWTIEGGGHTFPKGTPGTRFAGKVSQEIDAAELIWAFFSSHSRK